MLEVKKCRDINTPVIPQFKYSAIFFLFLDCLLNLNNHFRALY